MSKSKLETTYEDSLDVHPYSGHRLRQQPPLPPPPPHVVNAKNNLNSDVLSPDAPSSQTLPPPPPPPPKNIAARLTAKSEVTCSRMLKRRVVAPLPSVDEIRTAYAWTSLSTLYGRAIVILQVFFALTDVFINADDDYNYPRYQRWLLLYSYCVAFVILVAIYICTLNGKWPPSNSSVASLSTTSISNCSDPECRAIAKGYLADADADSSSLASGWSTLRRAYIRRQGLTATGFSLRLAALVYGVATLIYFGFELAVNTADEKRCVDDIDYALPIMAVVFSFLQIHCLFVNAQVLSASFYGGAHFCFVHLVATNVVLWMRTIIRQAATDWLVHHPNIIGNVTVTSSLSCASNNPLCEEAHVQFYPELRRLASLRLCLMNSTLGQMWLQATPFLLPLQLQFFVVSAAVFYVMWESVGCPLRRRAPSPIPPSIRRPSEVDNKGIFVGLLLLVGGVVVLVMYLVLRSRPQFTHDSLWVVSGTLSLVLGTAVLATLCGFLGLNRAPRLASIPTSAPLDKLLLSVTSLGPSAYALGGIVAGAASLKTNEHLLVLAHGSLLLVQSALQDVYIGERECRPNFRAGRRIALVLLFSNTALWLLDTFMTGGSDSQKPQREFYGVYAWAAIAYVAVPLTALYRLHAAVRLYEIWNRG